MDEKQFEIMIGKLNEIIKHLDEIAQDIYNLDQRDMKESFD